MCVCIMTTTFGLPHEVLTWGKMPQKHQLNWKALWNETVSINLQSEMNPVVFVQES